MAKFYDAKLSQTSGELSPLLVGRSDLAAYNNGAKEMTNCLVLPQGGFMNRNGVKRLDIHDIDSLSGSSTDANFGNCRLIPFVVNVDIAYVLVFRGSILPLASGAIDVIKNGERIHTFSGHPYMDHDDLISFRYLQSVDVMFLFSHNHPIMEIRRYADDNWEIKYSELNYGPFQDWNIDLDKVMNFSMTSYPSNVLHGTVTSNFDAFELVMSTGHISYSPLLKLEFMYPAGSFNEQIAITPQTPMPYTYNIGEMYGRIDIKTYDSFTGTIALLRFDPLDGAGWVTVSEYTSAGTTEGTFPVWGYSADENDQGVRYRIDITADVTSGTDTFKIMGNWSGGLAWYRLRITSINSSTSADVEGSGNDFGAFSGYNFSTTDWTFSAWGLTYDVRNGLIRDMGYPSVGIFHQERMILANSTSMPTSIWMSQPADWYNFDVSTPAKDTDSISVTLATKQMNAITDLSSRNDLLIFTEGGEFTATTGQRTDVFTPSSVIISPTDYKGSLLSLNVLDIGQSTLFVGRHSRAIYGIGYQLEQDGYSSHELSILSQHLFEEANVIRWSYQQYPWSIVWILLSDGMVLAFTFNQEHQIAAWTKHTFMGNVSDLCVIPGDGQDDLYLIIDNDLVMLQHRVDDYHPDLARWYMDESRDGYNQYKMSYESMELEQIQAQGTVQGRHKIVPRMTFRLYKTSGFKAGIINENSTKLDQILFSGDLTPIYHTVPFTGDVYMEVPGGFGKECRMRIEHDFPAPVTVLGMWREVGMRDDA